MRNITFTVTLPTDRGFIGRQCPAPDCGRYFKVKDRSDPDLYCPYCGAGCPSDELFTSEQAQHIKRQLGEKAKEIVSKELDRIFSQFARKYRTGPVQVKYSSSRYRAKPIRPSYREKEVDSELACPGCGVTFQVYGIFGYCPGCRNENQLIYDADLAILRQALTRAENPAPLRHAYADLVSTFEGFCKRRLSKEYSSGSFQNLMRTQEAFKKALGIDIFYALSPDDWLTLRRVFQKRHAYVHNKGVIEERYIRNVPEDAELLGQKALLSIEEFESGARILRVVIDRIVQAIPN